MTSGNIVLRQKITNEHRIAVRPGLLQKSTVRAGGSGASHDNRRNGLPQGNAKCAERNVGDSDFVRLALFRGLISVAAITGFYLAGISENERLTDPVPNSIGHCTNVIFTSSRHGPPTAMKPKISSPDSWALPKESAAQKAARRRKLHALLKKGMGLKPGELKASVRPGYYETFRAMEDPAPYGRRRSRR